MNTNKIFMDELNKAIVRTLEKGAILKELIEIAEFQRGIGKTTALIEFAINYNFGVVVKNKYTAKYFRESFKYPYIFSVNEIKRGMSPIKVVVDEGVDLNKVNETGLEVVTGFKTV